MTIDGGRARSFAYVEMARQADAIAELRSHGDGAIPDGAMWPALSRLAATHVLVWSGLDAVEETLERMCGQREGLPPMAFDPDAYRTHAAEMLQRWRALP